MLLERKEEEMIVVKSSKILDAVLEEANEQNVPPLLLIKKLTKMRDFPSMVNVSEVSPRHSGVINYNSNPNVDTSISWEHRRYCQMASMIEDMDGYEIKFGDLTDPKNITVVRRHTDLTAGILPIIADIKNRSFLLGNKKYETINIESAGFVEGDVLAFYEITLGQATVFVRRTLDRNSALHGRNHYTRYGREQVINNVKQYYYDQVFVCALSLGPRYSYAYERDIVGTFEKAWSKYKRTVVNDLRKRVKQEDLEEYVAENKCHRTQAIMDLSFKISALESAVSCYKNELLSAGCDMKRLKDYANTIDTHTRALKGLNYANRNVLGNRVMNVPGGKITIEKLLSRKTEEI